MRGADRRQQRHERFRRVGIVASDVTAAKCAGSGSSPTMRACGRCRAAAACCAGASTNADWKQFNKVLFERIQVYLKPGSWQPVDPTDLKMLIDYFHSDLVKAVQAEAPVVNAAAPGVLTVRIALTEPGPTNQVASLVGTAVPYGFAAEIGSGAATGKPVGSDPRSRSNRDGGTDPRRRVREGDR